MRNYPHGEKTYGTFLEEVMAASLRAFENQDVPFEELVDKLDLERDPSRNPLFDICMLVQNLPQAGRAENNFSFVLYKNPASRFDMTFIIHETVDGLYINIEYYTGLFKKETIQRLVSHFKQVIQTMITIGPNGGTEFDLNTQGLNAAILPGNNLPRQPIGGNANR